MELNVGDKVKVTKRFLCGVNVEELDYSTLALRDGTVVFVSDAWATVLVESKHTGIPIYRESFWKESIFKGGRSCGNEGCFERTAGE